MAKDKRDSQADSSFPFVVSNGPRPPTDPSVRTMIRKQAMKDVSIARRKRGNYARVNKGQPVTFEDTDVPIRSVETTRASSSSGSSKSATSGSTSPSASNLGTEATDYDEDVSSNLVRQSPAATACLFYNVPSPLSTVTGYESARMEHGVDLSMLTVLTSFNVGKSTISQLAADPTRLQLILFEEPQYSYLPFVPSRYGSSKVLATATDCLLAKVGSKLMPQPGSEAAVLKLYAKALRTLQEAITDKESSADADVLCAIQMMSIHELLEPSRDDAWSHHIQGSGRLVRHRSPDQFKTEYEKALFAGHIGPVVSEALFNNTKCYLEDPEWMEMYTSLIQESEHLTDRSELVISCRKYMLYLPSIWHDVGEAVCGDDLFNDEVLASLERRLRETHTRYLAWLEDYKSHCVARSLIHPSGREVDLRRELFGAALECLVINKRLLGVVCDRDRFRLETESQALAKLLIDLQEQPVANHSWLFTGHEVGVAQVTVLTKDAFEEDLGTETVEKQKLATRDRYMLWSGTLRGR